MTSDSLSATQPSRRDRLAVPDVLRGVAIIAMLLAHANIMLPNLPWVVKITTAQVNDLASPLFALVMGMSAQIVWNRRAGVAKTIAQQTIRGVLLIAIGVWMVLWGSWVAIVLQYLGLVLIVGVPLLLLRTRWLLGVLAVLTVVTQPILELARHSAWFSTQEPWVQEVGRWVLLGHSYRLVNLLPFFLLGALLLRHGFRRDGLLWTMAVIAPVAWIGAAVAKKFLEPVPVLSGDYLDTLHDVGLVFAVYVVVVLLAQIDPSGVATVRDAVFAPLRAWGQIALSLYLLHVAIIAVWNRDSGRPQENSVVGWLLVVVLPLTVAWVWVRFVGTGPVEWILGWVSGRSRPRAGVWA
ncbi:hypothetical protein GCM10025768_07350 [Microbacterium pseudoresistens]|uniref:Putative membrane protein YeiB n=1 Tax=Microbacterium pseudoresistens TaxID=640634 RepID=A0A7Y9EVB2_9MICO|nr:acyltransferase family protein [Microbacterium pseudoresistens]NYD54573.1 putative membrane protein YeiB [Microbacterium pseudoresistens]